MLDGASIGLVFGWDSPGEKLARGRDRAVTREVHGAIAATVDFREAVSNDAQS